MSDWRERVKVYIRQAARPQDKYGHQPRLYALAQRLGEGLRYDDDVVYAAAWMHDLGVFVGHRPEDAKELADWNHVPYTIERSRELLREWGFPESKLALVGAVIASHQPDDEPESVEAKLVHDADILEQLGVVGLLRVVVKVGRDTRYPTFTSVVPGLRRAAAELAGKTCLESARELAAGRANVLNGLLRALEDEAGEHLH
jgi:uncharacterized protein